jgi:hypothetical protein
METRTERNMKFILGASAALLLAMAVGPASAQTAGQPYPYEPMAQPYPGQTPAQSYSSPTAPRSYGGTTMTPSGTGAMTSNQQASQSTLPQGSYLNECKDVRMLQDTLTAFCPRGDGTWQTTQLLNASSCTGNVQIAGGDLVCETPQVGSTTAPGGYNSSAGGTYQDLSQPLPHYGAFGTGPQPTATSVSPPTYAPEAGQTGAAPYGTYSYNPYPPYPPTALSPYPALPPAGYPAYPPAPPAPAPQPY